MKKLNTFEVTSATSQLYGIIKVLCIILIAWWQLYLSFTVFLRKACDIGKRDVAVNWEQLHSSCKGDLKKEDK